MSYDYPTVKHVQEITAFKTKRLAKGAIETLKWLEDGAPHKFDGLKGVFRFNMEEFSRLNSCGTSCCIAGAIHHFSKRIDGGKEELGITDLNKNFNLKNGLRTDYCDFDNDQKNLMRLFYALNKYGEQTRDLEKITPKQAAKTLRHYLETGKIKWSHVPCF